MGNVSIATLREHAALLAQQPARDKVMWRADWNVWKFADKWDEISAQLKAGAAVTDPQFEQYLLEEPTYAHGNLLMYGGASNLWQCLIGNGTATAAQTLTFFNNGNAYIGVGDSTTSEAATQTDLQASTNKERIAMDASYPSHTDGTTSGAATIQFRSTFASGNGNFAWAEWGVFNRSSSGRMLNRKVAANGTKSSGSSWVFTVSLTLA